MNWDDLRYLLAVARHGTISDGARSLQVNPTTVSRRIRALEEEMGAALFEKLRHGAILTAAGQDMVDVAISMEQMAFDLDARIHGLNTRLEGTIRVASVEQLQKHWLPDFRDFQTQYPGVCLELTSGLSMANFTQREADIAIRIASSVPEHLIGRKLAEVRHAVYGSREMVETVGREAGYDKFPWIAYDPAVFRGIDSFLEKRVPGARIVMRVSGIRMMVDAIEAGVGISILNCLAGDSNPNLVRVGDHEMGGVHLWVLTLPQQKGSARILAFTRFMRGVIERDRDLLEGRSAQPR